MTVIPRFDLGGGPTRYTISSETARIAINTIRVPVPPEVSMQVFFDSIIREEVQWSC